MGLAQSLCCSSQWGKEEYQMPRPVTPFERYLSPYEAVPTKHALGKVVHAAFITDNEEPLANHYKLGKKALGVGGFSTVTTARCKTTGDVRAIKMISKARMGDTGKENVLQEIKIMKTLNHPYIIKLQETFEDEGNIYLVMELCTGGDLSDRILEVQYFTEKQAAHLMMQIFNGIFYCHQVGVCHRDIKPENCVFHNKDPIEQSTLKIIDFGISSTFTPGQTFKATARTSYYVAPEVLSGRCNQACDMWSCGVVMYVMLSGDHPFSGDIHSETLEKVQRANLAFDLDAWKGISEDAKHLMRMCLQNDPEVRYTAGQAVEDVWIKDRDLRCRYTPSTSGLVNNLHGFQSQPTFPKATLHPDADHLKEKQIEALRDTFMTVDANGDGVLTSAEFAQGLKTAGFNEMPVDFHKIMDRVDSNGNGVIGYTEFLAATEMLTVFMQESVCWSAFRVFDRNGDGTISREELMAIIGDEYVSNVINHTAETIDELMKEVDVNGNGNIDFKEFMQMMRASAEAR